MEFVMTKQAYETPKMESLGSFEKLTQAVDCHGNLDSNAFTPQFGTNTNNPICS